MVKIDETQDAILQNAIELFGEQSQIEMMIEECSELIQALQKLKRKGEADTIDHVQEELADVAIMIQQMHHVFNENGEITSWVNRKIARLKKRIDSHGN